MIGSRHRRNTGRAGDLPGLKLVAHDRDVFSTGADKCDFVIGASLRELGSLGEKTVAGMKRVAPGGLGGRDQVPDFEIAVGRPRRADADGAAGYFCRETFAIRFGNGGNGFDP